MALAGLFGLLALWPLALGGQDPPQPPPRTAAAEALADYSGLLARYVSNGQVDYARWKADDPPEWRRLLAWLETATPQGQPADTQRAFWINAYNARVIAGVLERYPLDSVRDVGYLGGRVRGFFGLREHPVAGRSRTLDEIEREILLKDPLWDERIHWALTCASRGCPRLREEPYVGERLDMQLDFQARTYLNSPLGSRLDREAQVLYLTRIFEWSADDFRRAAGSVREYAARYLTGTDAEAARDTAFTTDYLEYDWGLNDAH